MAIDAELKRRRASDGAIVPWYINDDGTEPTNDELTHTKLDAVIAKLNSAFPSGGTATETTLAKILEQLDDATTDTVLSILKSINVKDFATSTKQDTQLTRLNLLATEVKVQELIDNIGSISATPTANTLQERLKKIFDALDGVESSLSTLSSIDFATQTTLASRASESTLASRASESTLSSASIKLDDVNTKLTGIDTKLSGTLTTDSITHRTSPTRAWAILQGLVADTEEVRVDIPSSLINGNIYKGAAIDNASTSSGNLWDVVRVYFDSSGKPSRIRFQSGINWDNRTSGWS